VWSCSPAQPPTARTSCDGRHDTSPTPFTGHRVDDVTHLLRTELGTASVRTYKKQGREPIDQRVTALLVDWVTTRTQAENGAGDGNP
jgi:hypothetical protein